MAARLMHKAGLKIVAIIEYDGAVYNAGGIDPFALEAHRKETGSIVHFPGAEDIDRDEAMFLPCDVLLPGARENVIHSRNATGSARRFCAREPTADHGSGRQDSGGAWRVRNSRHTGQRRRGYGELLRMVQDRQGFFWNEQLVNERLEEIMVNSFNDIVGYAEKHKVNNRTAAYMVALDRVAFAIRLRGIYA